MIHSRIQLIVIWGSVIGAILCLLSMFVIGIIWQASLLVSMPAGWMIVFAFLRINSTYIPARSFVLKSDGFAHLFPKGVWVWNGTYALLLADFGDSRGSVVSYAQQTVCLDLTADEGRITCHMVIIRKESPRAVIALNEFLKAGGGKWDSFEALAQYICYEFIHALEFDFGLGGLFNPLEKEQQARFQKRLTEFINEFVAEGGEPDERPFLGIGTCSHFALSSQPQQWVVNT